MLHFTNPLLKASILAMAASAMTACSPSHTEPQTDNRILDVASIHESASLSPEQKSEKMAKASERLVTPASFMYASEVADAAVAHDPKNARARFWKAALAPVMELKGVLTRIERLVKQRPQAYANFAKMVADIKTRNPERSVTEFLFDGPADINTEREAQELVARVTLKLDEFRKVVKQLKEENAEFSIYINDEAAKSQSMADAIKSCPWRETSPFVYELGECDLSGAYEVTLNRADFEGIQHVIAGYQTYITLLNVYDLSGVYKKSTHLGHGAQQDLALLLKDAKFGTLRETHGLGAIPDAAADTVMGVKYARELQRELCPKGRPDPANRPGHLFRDGLCIGNSVESDRILWMVEKVLAGETIPVQGTQVNPLKAFTSPVQDLRSLTPIETNSCGLVTKVNEPTLNGVFPEGDLNDLLADSAARNCDARL